MITYRHELFRSKVIYSKVSTSCQRFSMICDRICLAMVFYSERWSTDSIGSEQLFKVNTFSTKIAFVNKGDGMKLGRTDRIQKKQTWKRIIANDKMNGWFSLWSIWTLNARFFPKRRIPTLATLQFCFRMRRRKPRRSVFSLRYCP